MYTATEKRPDFKLIRKRFCQNAFASGTLPRTPLGGLQRPRPPAGKGWVTNQSVPWVSTVPHSEGQSRIFIRCPAVPRNQQMSRIFRKWYYYFFRCRLDPILHVCLATQQSDELRIKIGKDRFRIRTSTGH